MAPVVPPSPHRIVDLRVPAAPGQAPLALSWTPGAAPDSAAWVFLHGFGSDRQGGKPSRFRDWLHRRGPGFAAYDCTGHGDSGGDCRGLSLSRNLEDLGRVLACLGERSSGPITLIGSSMGGITALWYAARHPRMVEQVYAIAPAFLMFSRFRAGLPPGEAEAWEASGRLSAPVGDTVLEVGWEAVTDERRYPTGELADELQVPTRIFHGSDDEVVPVSLSRDFAADCPVADLVEIDGGDHRLHEFRDFLFESMWDEPLVPGGRGGR